MSQVEKPDIALELPTGTGKTLTGLLIAEWTRRSKQLRVIYACPTRQLARQVADAAHREGISTSLLVGSHANWETSAQLHYEAAETIAVTTYSSIFNSNPHLAIADLILFDDAHAGEQYVGEAFSVVIDRWDNFSDYQAVVNAIAPALDDVFLERLQAFQPDLGFQKEVRLVVPLRQEGMVHNLHTVLSQSNMSIKFRFSMIRSGLASCLVYVSHSEILIRPYIPPTYQNELFSNATQRVYLSATLGEGGELERAFGRENITRLQHPDESTAPRYGRRFFVFPEMVDAADETELNRSVIAEAGKALILASSTKAAQEGANALAQPGWPVLGVAEVGESMEAFAKLVNGVCGLAARYDGLDLPGDTCRLVALDGVPNKNNLQENFLQSKARAGVVIASRVRTRVIQGAGRCTRGPGDTAIVLVIGAELTRYLTRPEVVAALDSELQAELRFGRDNSEAGSSEELLQRVSIFLKQDTDDTWRTQAEPTLAEYRREMSQQVPAGTSSMADCASDEIKAWAAAAAGAWSVAAKHAHEVARIVGTGREATRGYRAFWTYLEAIWVDQAAADNNDHAGRVAAQRLIRSAEKIAGLGSWVRQMAPLPAMQRSSLSAVDATAVNNVVAMLESGVKQGKTRDQLEEMQVGLEDRKPSRYEPALTDLGHFVGATASKPAGHGRCDSTWCWDNELWLALEAKSNHEPSGSIPHKDVRQANDQLRLLASDRAVHQIPPESATILISPKPTINKDGIGAAEQHVYIVTPSLISQVAQDVNSAWDRILVANLDRSTSQLRELVADTFSLYGVLPSQIREKLTRDPISSRTQ